MDPISTQAANLLSAVQALQVRPGTAPEGPSLMALLGQDLDMLFQAQVPGGVQLQLASGQVLTAQGRLPYPDGTQLRVRVLPAPQGEAGIRLQVKEASPPPLPALLAPLIQGEAAPLAARLALEPPLPELLPLVRLLAVLQDPPTLPSPGQVQQALGLLPEALKASLGQALGANGEVPTQELASLLQTFLADLHGAPDPFGEQAAAQLRSAFARHPGLPADDQEPLIAWLRRLVQKPAGDKPEAPRVLPTIQDARTGAPAKPNAGADALIPPRLKAALQAHAGSKADLPESWEAWIRGTVTTLSDPAASPREAPFHALQAKEGTAFFEVPLPWVQAGSLQLWVESDAPEERRQGGESTRRLLLGLRFSRLGETRLGLAQGASALQVRVWVEHPEALEGERDRIQEELEALGKATDLRIYALAPGADGTIPTLRSLAAGPSLSALG